ncbi:MAG: helix-turn-helix transcriptional regulator [Spirochaetes bacterium]|nr:helix-turn-helix transcriptional regulator [Spirochaetota bacterium]
MGIYHAWVLVDLVALSLGVGIIFVALLSWERSGIRWLRDLAFVLFAGTVLLMLDLFRLYALGTGWPPGPTGRTVLATLSGAGNLVLVLAVPAFVKDIVPLPPSRFRRVLRPIGTVLITLLGVLDEVFDVAVFHVMNDLGIAGLLVSAAVIMAVGYRRITEPETRRMVKRMMWLTIGSIVLSRSQLLVMSLLGVALVLRRVRVVQVFYYLGMLAVVLVYAVKHLFRPSGTPDLLPSQEFVKRYGISNREHDIVAMIMQGHANRVIAERLFISDRTVKNHISTIYRKSGAVNKVQLINMVRNHPG